MIPDRILAPDLSPRTLLKPDFTKREWPQSPLATQKVSESTKRRDVPASPVGSKSTTASPSVSKSTMTTGSTATHAKAALSSARAAETAKRTTVTGHSRVANMNPVVRYSSTYVVAHHDYPSGRATTASRVVADRFTRSPTRYQTNTITPDRSPLAATVAYAPKVSGGYTANDRGGGGRFGLSGPTGGFMMTEKERGFSGGVQSSRQSTTAEQFPRKWIYTERVIPHDRYERHDAGTATTRHTSTTMTTADHRHRVLVRGSKPSLPPPATPSPPYHSRKLVTPSSFIRYSTPNAAPPIEIPRYSGTTRYVYEASLPNRQDPELMSLRRAVLNCVGATPHSTGLPPGLPKIIGQDRAYDLSESLELKSTSGYTMDDKYDMPHHYALAKRKLKPAHCLAC